MSVRRLAEETVQPASFAFTKENESWAAAKIAEYPAGRQQSAVLALLWRAQEQEGWVTRPAIETVARMLGMAYIRVLEVATFYTQFLLQPVGSRAHIMVCGTTPCMLRGAEDLRAVCERRIHPDAFETNEAGTLSWEEVECLGACVNAPMVMIGKDTYEDLTVERFEEIVDAFEAGDGDKIAPGPQIARVFSAAAEGATTLLEEPTAERTYRAFPPPSEPAPAAKAPAPAPKAEKPASKTADATKPLFAAPAGKADDLKLISGVGPVLEKALNGQGIVTYAQLAALKPAEIEALEERLTFKGRVERDDWIRQAEALAKGGEAEYIRVFGKKPR